MKKRLAVIGGGASGITAAIEARALYSDADVTVFERMPRLCKKILATGNGRCNFTNENLSPSHFHGNHSFLKAVLTSAYADSENYFRSLGVLSYHEDGRIYPRSQQSSAIRDALISKAEALGVCIKTESTVNSIRKNKEGFLVNGEQFDAIITSTGGKACAVQGSDGSLFPVLKSLGHTVTPLYPALCGLTTPDNALNILKGVRAEVYAQLYSGSILLGEESGEVQFTDKGISGIPVMNLSHYCKDNKSILLCLDLCREICFDDLKEHFALVKRTQPDLSLEAALSGVLNTKLGYAVVNKARIQKNTPLKHLSSKSTDDLIRIIKCFKINVSGTRGFDNAQITCGGILTNEINPLTMMSHLHNGLFICGEALDIHGDCGGYNLHLAWTTGRIAGVSAANYLRDNL